MQVHAYVMSHLKKEMPSMFGKDSRKKELINNLGNIFAEIQREHQISPGDFPDLARMQEQLQHHVRHRLSISSVCIYCIIIVIIFIVIIVVRVNLKVICNDFLVVKVNRWKYVGNIVKSI